MEVLFMLIAFSILIAIVFLGYFMWAVRNGQYDDNFTPAVRILLEDEQPSTMNNETGGERNQRF